MTDQETIADLAAQVATLSERVRKLHADREATEHILRDYEAIMEWHPAYEVCLDNRCLGCRTKFYFLLRGDGPTLAEMLAGVSPEAAAIPLRLVTCVRCGGYAHGLLRGELFCYPCAAREA